jgi:copper chaperone CopZ
MEITQRMSVKGVAMSVNRIQVHVENIKCGGCKNSIVKGLNSIEGLSNIVIDRVS